MASYWYGKGLLALAGGGIDLDGDTIVAILLDSTYTPDQDAHEFVSDLTGELVDASYGRVTLTGKALSYDAATNAVELTSDPIVFAALDDTFRHMVLASSTGSDATSRLIKWSDYLTDQTYAGTDATITPDADGLVRLVAG